MTQLDPGPPAAKPVQPPTIQPAHSPSDGDQLGDLGRWIVAPRTLALLALLVAVASFALSRGADPVNLPGYTGTPEVDAVIAQAAIAERQDDALIQVVLWSLGTVGVIAAALLGVSIYQNRWASERERRSVIAEVRSHTDSELAASAVRVSTLEGQLEEAIRVAERRLDLEMAGLQRQIDPLRLAESLRVGPLRRTLATYFYALIDELFLVNNEGVGRREKEETATLVSLMLRDLHHRPEDDKALDQFEHRHLVTLLSLIEKVYGDRFTHQVQAIRNSYSISTAD